MSLRRKLLISGAFVVVLGAGAVFALWWFWVRGDAPPPAALAETEVAESAGPLAGD